MDNVASFPEVKFVTTNSPWKQLRHLASEVIEVAVALAKRDRYQAAKELWDVIHSAETLLRILVKRYQVDAIGAREEILSGNMERGYYEVG
jgi:NTP pyrophosphatase (non-canonical NTP hydrolase)